MTETRSENKTVAGKSEKTAHVPTLRSWKHGNQTLSSIKARELFTSWIGSNFPRTQSLKT
jgi:hypothetical protein